MMMALGLFAFGLPTLAFDELQRRMSWRHATTPRIGARDAAQFTGPGEETVSLSGTAFAELCDGIASLAEIEAMAITGKPWPLVDGTGRVFGAFVIQTLDEGHKHLFADGTARAIDFSMSLLRVDDVPAR